MDDADRAKRFEIQDREAAVNKALKRPQQPAQKRNTDGDVICIDCEAIIPEDRLTAKPDAARCLDCKTRWEHKNQ